MILSQKRPDAGILVALYKVPENPGTPMSVGGLVINNQDPLNPTSYAIILLPTEATLLASEHYLVGPQSPLQLGELQILNFNFKMRAGNVLLVSSASGLVSFNLLNDE